VRVLPTDQPKTSVDVKVEIAVSAPCELLMSLSLFDSPIESRDIYDVGPSWFTAVESSASRQLLTDVQQSTLAHHTWTSLIGMAWTTPAPADIPAFLAHLQATDAFEMRLQMLSCFHDSTPGRGPSDEMVRAAAAGDAAAQRRLGEIWFPEDLGCRESLQRGLSMDTESSKRHLIDILDRWYEEVFRADEPRVMPILRRDAETRRQQARALPAERLIELATNGIRYVPTPGLNRVVLIPSVLFRPWVMIAEHQDARIFCHPVSDESLTVDRDAPPMHLLRLYEALADERRLRIVRRLARESMTLQEMSDFLGIAKSTMHHHLAVLRGAGLLQCESGSKRYELRRDALSDLSGLLSIYVDEPSSA
jgi:DNA-binding transcriptional ArsR family regulator